MADQVVSSEWGEGSCEGLNVVFLEITIGAIKSRSLLKKYKIVSVGVKSDWKDGLRTAVYETRTYGGVRGAPHQLPLVGPSTRLAAFIVFNSSSHMNSIYNCLQS